MTEQSEKYQKALKAARDRDPEVNLVLDTTAEDTDWIRGKRRGGHAARTVMFDAVSERAVVREA